jgi:hypothetical protein
MGRTDDRKNHPVALEPEPHAAYPVSGMSGERNIDALLRTLSPRLVDGLFVFATVGHEALPEGLVPRMIFREAEGTTLILLKSEAEACGLACEFPCRMITLEVHSSLEAVGFMARIATELAGHGMGVNPVSGFFHDHLFVPDGREQDALQVLERMARSVG